MPPFVNYHEDIEIEPENVPQSTLFDEAISNNDIHTVQEMINNGYDVDQPAFIIVNNQMRERYPLIFAIVNGFFDIVDVLLNAGSNINYKDMRGLNSIMYVANLGHVEVLQKLIINLEAFGVVNIINETDDSGWSALMIACEEGHRDIVEILLDAGANKNILNNNNQTASVIADINNHINIVNLLNGRN